MLVLKGLWEFFWVGAALARKGGRPLSRGVLDMLASWSVQAYQLFGLKAPHEPLRSETLGLR
jgi:hypothetical protein